MGENTSESPSASADDVFFNDSRLFVLRPLFDFATEKCTFCENGRKKVFAGVSEAAFYFYLMEGDEKKASKEIPWDSKKYSVIDLCFDPSGTWLLVLSPTTLQIVPVLPLLEPDVKHDLRWPTNKITTITLNPNHAKDPSAIVWWQTKDSQQIAIIGDKAGDLVFFSLETLEIIGKTCIVGGVHKLTIYFDDPLDSTTLLITSNKNRQWKLLLEHRPTQYNWIGGRREQRKTKDLNLNFDEFFASIKELGSNKMSTLFQTKSPTVADIPTKLNNPVVRYNPTPISMEHHSEPCTSKSQSTDEMGIYGPTNLMHWLVAPQRADGRHFISFYNSTSGIFTLKMDAEDRTPVFTFKLEGLLTDVHTVLWQHKIIFSFGPTVIQVHSCALASQQDANLYTLIWEDDLNEGEHVIAAWGVQNSLTFAPWKRKWIESQKVEDLDLPRFGLDSCIVVTNKKTYLLTTRCNPCEWLVTQLVSGRRGVERTAAALAVKLQPLLVAAADVLLIERKIPQAMTLYKLAKVNSDEPLNRCGALGLYYEMLSSGFTPQSVSTGNICFMAHILESMMMYQDDTELIGFIQSNNHFSVPECLTLCANLGLWNSIWKIGFGKGMVWLSFQSLVYRITTPCRGLWSILLNKYFVPFIISDTAIPLLKYIEQYYETFDDYLLKNLCIWMSPLQDCFYIVHKALSTSQPNGYLSGMKRLIRVFFGVLSTLHSRMEHTIPGLLLPKDDFSEQLSESLKSPTTYNNLSLNVPYPTVISSGHTHWGVTHNGKVQIKHMDSSLGYVNVDVELYGKAISVACGRHHVLLLTDNGLYALGDNQFGQLGVGSSMRCAQDTFILVGVMGGNFFDKREFYWKNEVVTHIATGQYHSACITNQGALYTWGWGVHGQLAHGTIVDEFIPKKVQTLNNEKVTSVGCGACHTAILTASGKILLCGSGAFGQIGHSDRHKCNLPYEVNLGPHPVTKIAVGYFHTLALTETNELWCWGSSPQSLRVGARGARRARGLTKDDDGQQKEDQTPPSPPPSDENPHLYPSKVNITNVKGAIKKMSAGWHHSCLVDEFGHLYVWGLNLDGQLGTGDQKEILVPTHVEIENVEEVKSKSPPKSIFVSVPAGNASYHHTKDCSQSKQTSSRSSIKKRDHCEIKSCVTRTADVACGSDFTIYLNTQGKLFIAGNSYQQFQDASVKGLLHIVKLKNTKRVLRLPNSRPPAQRMFRHFTLPSNILESSYVNIMETTYQRVPNPLSSLEDFKNPFWAFNTLAYLHKFIDDDTPLLDIHLRSQLAILRKDYAEALSLQLNSLFGNCVETSVPLYYQHTSDDNSEKLDVVKSVILENIKKQSRNLLNSDYTETDKVDSLPCLCDETDYLFSSQTERKNKQVAKDITDSASQIIRTVLNVLPPNTTMWSECVNQATLFWIDHELNMSDLEEVLSQVVNSGHVINMASAIFCTKQNIDYQKHLSPAFNLELCDNFLQYW